MTGSVLLGIFIATNAGYFYLDPESIRFAPWLALYTLQFGPGSRKARPVPKPFSPQRGSLSRASSRVTTGW